MHKSWKRKEFPRGESDCMFSKLPTGILFVQTLLTNKMTLRQRAADCYQLHLTHKPLLHVPKHVFNKKGAGISTSMRKLDSGLQFPAEHLVLATLTEKVCWGMLTG